jgi:phosphoserine phosphatase RsbU/P
MRLWPSSTRSGWRNGPARRSPRCRPHRQRSIPPTKPRVLDPEERSAAVARRAVEGALAKAGFGHLLDEALLLVTELVTNAVVHAGTLVDLQILTDDAGLRVEVADAGPGGFVQQGPPDDTREGGRGLFLLDALATEWGTSSSAGRKAVWFRLGRLPAFAPPPPLDVLAGPRRDLAFLTGLLPGFERKIGPDRVVTELLRRLVEGLERERGWVLFAEPGSGRWVVRAAYDDRPPPDLVAMRLGRDPDHQATPFHDAAGEPWGALVLSAPAAPPEPEDALAAQLVADRIGLVLREQHSAQAQRQTRDSLALLAEAGEMFAGTLDVRLAATLAARLVVPRLATWAAVWTTYGHGAQLQAVAHVDESQAEALQAALSSPAARALVAELQEGPQPGKLARLAPGQLSLPGEHPRSGPLLLPLIARRRLLGLLLAGVTDAEADPGLYVDLARMAAMALDNARLYEERSRVVEALQASLLPPRLPQPAGIEFGAWYAAAGEGNDVGGDFYDTFSLAGGKLGIAIGDVCGKGATAAAITGIAREVLSLLLRKGTEPPDALRELNETLLGLGERSRFCTVALGTVEASPAGVTVRFSSAGHPPPVHLTAAGSATFVGGSGTLLGVLPALEVSDDVVVLAPGDCVVFYTDGLTERRTAGSMFGETHLLATLRSLAGLPAADVAAGLEAAAAQFDAGAEPRDDLAVLIIRHPG